MKQDFITQREFREHCEMEMMEGTVQHVCAHLELEQFHCNHIRAAFTFLNQD